MNQRTAEQKERYAAYVGTYTHGTSVGIHIYDVDEIQGTIRERKVIPINNPSDLTISKNGDFLYSIADEGVEAFRILPDGNLEKINGAWIGGMRGCRVVVDDENRYLYVAGYHDGRVSMMRLREDGGIEGIADGIFHQGMGRSVAQRNSRPHVNDVVLTPVNQNYVCAVDGGLDHVKIYEIDKKDGKMHLADILRCPLDSAPRALRFTKNGKFAYVLCELKNTIEVYQYECTSKGPVFEFVESVQTVNEKDMIAGSSASGMEISEDGLHLFCSNAGANTVMIFDVDQETGRLTEICNSMISGNYPKTLGIFPDGKHFASLNHDSNEITLFQVDYEKKIFLMETRPVPIETPNCIRFHKLK